MFVSRAAMFIPPAHTSFGHRSCHASCSQVLFAGVWSGLPLASPLMTELLRDATEMLHERGLSSLTPQQLCRLAWSLASWGLPAYAKLHLT
jgi:hypothetical protein